MSEKTERVKFEHVGVGLGDGREKEVEEAAKGEVRHLIPPDIRPLCIFLPSCPSTFPLLMFFISPIAARLVPPIPPRSLRLSRPLSFKRISWNPWAQFHANQLSAPELAELLEWCLLPGRYDAEDAQEEDTDRLWRRQVCSGVHCPGTERWRMRRW